MKERPILFSGPMVRAILDGRKTQTRRLVKVLGAEADRYPDGIVDVTAFIGSDSKPTGEYGLHSSPCVISSHVRCPYGAPGDRLWVRETWSYCDWTEDGMPWIRYAADDTRRLCERVTPDWATRVADAWAELSSAENVAVDGLAADRKWRPSIFLPRWASRITLEVAAVRVERLQEIGEDDARAEGIPDKCDHGCSSLCGCASCIEGGCQTAAAQVAALWDSINGDRASWDANPWVWVVEFRRVA